LQALGERTLRVRDGVLGSVELFADLLEPIFLGRQLAEVTSLEGVARWHDLDVLADARLLGRDARDLGFEIR
jgi:hypothetical protein